MKTRTARFRLLPAVPVFVLLAISGQAGLAQSRSGDVYVMTNQSSGNAVLVFHRDPMGALTPAGSFLTGGNGMGTGGDPLASQGALVLSEDERLLFAVNAGSDSISMFAVSGDQLTLLDTTPSGGTRPVSVAVRHGLVYVLNAGGAAPNISGFRVNTFTNRLAPLAGSTRNLPGGASSNPAQVSFTPEGDVLVVTEKGTNKIDTFPLYDGIAGPGASFASGGSTPFGFGFSHENIALVSDAGGGAGGAAASSYRVNDNGGVTTISAAVGDGQTAACWLVVSRNGRIAYVANAGTATISSYSVSEHGALSLVQAVAASTGVGSGPTDMHLAGNGRFLYVRDGGNGAVSGFAVGAGGSLTPIGSVGGVPSGAQGIAAR